MLFHQFEDKGLAQYSYAVGCPAQGRIAIVDPRRDIDLYLDFAKEQKVRISHVLETHIHADFASGARELAARTGAELALSAYDRGEVFETAFPHAPVRDGDLISIGPVRIQAMHTPGHTPEHLAFLVFDESRSPDTPLLLMSGDFLFVGSLGRPDLLGAEAARGLASRLFASLERIASLPDGLEIYPGHGAGSMCGAGMSGRAVSTLGYERIANPYLDPRLSEGEFVEKILTGLPPQPPYYQRMKRLNSQGPSILEGLPGLQPMDADTVKRLMQDGHLLIDLRDQASYGQGHIERSFAIGGGPKVSEWASWLVPYERPLLLLGPDQGTIESAVRSLVRVGLDDVRGYLEGGIESWSQAGYPLRELAQVTPEQAEPCLRRGEARVLDVRRPGEWKEGHVEGAVHLPAGEVPSLPERIPADDAPLVVACATGYRSTAIASLLERQGHRNLRNLSGGMEAWKRAGLAMSGN